MTLGAAAMLGAQRNQSCKDDKAADETAIILLCVHTSWRVGERVLHFSLFASVHCMTDREGACKVSASGSEPTLD
jgi:hypothetical protein